MNKKITVIASIGLAVAPLVAFAQIGTIGGTTGATLATVVQKLVSLFNLIVPVIATAAIAFFFYGLVRYIYNSGDAKHRAVGRQAIIWGLAGLLLIFFLRGMIALVQQDLLGTGFPSTGYMHDQYLNP